MSHGLVPGKGPSPLTEEEQPRWPLLFSARQPSLRFLRPHLPAPSSCSPGMHGWHDMQDVGEFGDLDRSRLRSRFLARFLSRFLLFLSLRLVTAVRALGRGRWTGACGCRCVLAGLGSAPCAVAALFQDLHFTPRFSSFPLPMYWAAGDFRVGLTVCFRG